MLTPGALFVVCASSCCGVSRALTIFPESLFAFLRLCQTHMILPALPLFTLFIHFSGLVPRVVSASRDNEPSSATRVGSVRALMLERYDQLANQRCRKVDLLRIRHSESSAQTFQMPCWSITGNRQRCSRKILDRPVVLVQYHQSLKHEVAFLGIVLPVFWRLMHQAYLTTLKVSHRSWISSPALHYWTKTSIVEGHSRMPNCFH